MAGPSINKKQWTDGDEVWIPVAEVRKIDANFEPAHGGSLAVGKLAGRVDGEELRPGTPRTWNVDVPGLVDDAGIMRTIPISSRRFRRHAKILIFRIGDWETEQTALNPLAASLKAQLSLLVAPSEVDVEYIRTLDELAGALRVHGGGGAKITARRASPWGYALLVGHGRSGSDAGIRFGDSWHGPTEIAEAIKNLGPGRRAFGDAIILSTCCETGHDSFARPFSDALNTTFAGPDTTVHSFEAAGMVQRLFFEHFLAGYSWADAFRRTRRATADFSTSFRFWRDGFEAQAT